MPSSNQSVSCSREPPEESENDPRVAASLLAALVKKLTGLVDEVVWQALVARDVGEHAAHEALGRDDGVLGIVSLRRQRVMADLAARRIGENDNAARMRDSFKRLLAYREDGGTAAFLDARRYFYDTIMRIGGNHELIRILPLMQIHLLRMQFQAYITPRDREKQFKEYAAITETILSGNGARARAAASSHIRRTRLSLMRLPDEAFPSVAK